MTLCVCAQPLWLKWQKRASNRLVHSPDTLRYSPTRPKIGDTLSAPEAEVVALSEALMRIHT